MPFSLPIALCCVSLALGIAPLAHASDVTAVLKGTTLKVTGDDLGLELTVSGVPEGETFSVPAFVRVVVEDGLVNGVDAPATFNGVTQLSLKLGDATNTVILRDLTLTGGVDVKGGGLDYITFAVDQFGDDVKVSGGPAGLVLTCTTGVFGGKFQVKSGSADDNVAMGCEVAGAATYSLGNGLNVFSMTTNASADSLSIKAGGDYDQVVLAGEVDQDAKVSLGNGGATVGIADLDVGGDLSCASGNGADTFNLNTLEVDGKVALKLGNGANTVIFGATSTAIGESLSASSGGGADTFIVNNTSVGDATFKMGNGANDLVMHNSLIGDDLTVTAGSGADSVSLNGTTSVGDKTSIHLGGGSNTQP